MKTHFEKTEDLIIEVIKNGDMELLAGRIQYLEKRIEDMTEQIDNWDKIHPKLPQKFDEIAFNRLELHMWQVELDMLLNKKRKFTKK